MHSLGYEATVEFYRRVLGFKIIEQSDKSVAFDLGSIQLWIDCVDNYSQADVWLELRTGDIKMARKYLQENNVPIRNEIEKLPNGLEGSWISDPAGVIYLVHQQ